jgi:5-methylcytosine-specific restriction endonuclease McrA
MFPCHLLFKAATKGGSNMTHAEKELRNQRIVELRKQGYSMNQLSEMFNLTNISGICKRYGVAGVMSDRKADYSKLPQLQHKPSEDYAREVIERKLDGFSYFGNYTGSSGTADIQCNVCGDVFTQPFTSIRKGCNVFCRNCKKIEKDKAREAARAIRLAERQQRQRKQDLELFLSTYQVECVVCGKIFVTHRSNAKCCSPECRKKYNNSTSTIRKDKRIAKDKRIDKGITAKRLYKRDGGVCWICGGMCDLNDYVVTDSTIICGDYYPSVDHVVAVCDGGEDSWDNVRLAHRICNSMRYYKKVTPSYQRESA